jgi:hypothetical protein
MFVNTPPLMLKSSPTFVQMKQSCSQSILFDKQDNFTIISYHGFFLDPKVLIVAIFYASHQLTLGKKRSICHNYHIWQKCIAN